MVKRVLVGLLALVLIVVGGAAGAAAIWADRAFDDEGVMSFDAGTITPGPNATATIVDVDRFGATIPYIGQFGTTRLAATTGESADPSSTLFMGAAGTPEVDAYLKGSPYTVAIRDGSEWATRDIPGTLLPALPRDEDFWLAQAVGPMAAIMVPGERPLTIVMMHPAGVPTGPLTLAIEFVVPTAPRWILGLGIASAVLVILGIVLLILAFRMRGRRGRHEDGVPAVAETAVAETVVAETAVAETVVAETAEETVVAETDVAWPATDDTSAEPFTTDEPEPASDERD